MITHIVISILILTLFIHTSVHGDKCTPFKENDSDIFEEIYENVDNFYRPIIKNITDNYLPSIENIYKEYKNGKYIEDRDLNIMQLVNKYGYPIEKHEVETSDGYLLNMFRIPNDGSPVFLMHGVLSSADDFFTIGSNSGIGYLLADAGYDVWLGNARGNKHSRRHVTLSPDCKEFWDFSFDEIGRYDLPAKIDYILNKTNEEQLTYIGHSMGSTAFFVLCSELPEYNSKIKVMIALSAVAFLPNASWLTAWFSIFDPLVTKLADAIGLYEVLPRNALLQHLTDTFCGTKAIAEIVCGNILLLTSGADFSQVNGTALVVIFGHYPSGTSTRVALHYSQMSETGKFRRYNYGTGNLVKYNSILPPDYPVEKITAPVVVYYAPNDRLTTMESIMKLKSRIQNLSKIITVPYEKFSHADYIFARDVKRLLYDNVLDLLYSYNTV